MSDPRAMRAAEAIAGAYVQSQRRGHGYTGNVAATAMNDLVEELSSLIAREYAPLLARLEEAERVIAGVREALSRQYEGGGGTMVINCVVHSGPLTGRPTDCSRCATDVQSQLGRAIRANEFLNEVVVAARAYLAKQETSP